MKLILFLTLAFFSCAFAAEKDALPAPQRRLYVAVPGIRDYLQYGGHGLLVFDMDNGHKFVRRIKTSGLNAKGKPLNVKGVCASAVSDRIYVGTTETLTCLRLSDDAILWEKPYEGGCDRMSIAPDGKFIYLPSFEKGHWHVVDALTGDVMAKIKPNSGAHNTIVGLNGKEAYLAGLRSPLVTVADTASHTAARTIGPFSAPVRPFTVDGKQTRLFACVNELLGFEVADIVSGRVLHQVKVEGFNKGEVKRHGCPSHGIGLTPDEHEVWLCDAANQRLHVFDATISPPALRQSIEVREQPGWVTFSVDGRYAYPSTGEVIDAATKKIVAVLSDETGAAVHSEKMLEVQFAGGKPTLNGDQFGLGRVVAASPAPVTAEKEPGMNWTFEGESAGPVEEGYLITDGVFEIAACGEKNQALAVQAEPIVASGVQLGESLKLGALTATARILGTKKGRITPQFGLGVHGESGYRVRVSPALKKIELVRGELVLAEAPFVWESGKWCHVQLQIVQDKDGYVFQGNAWMDGQTAPPMPLLLKQEPLAFKGQGRLTLYATPFAGTPVFFDDVKLATAPNASAAPSPAP